LSPSAPTKQVALFLGGAAVPAAPTKQTVHPQNKLIRGHGIPPCPLCVATLPRIYRRRVWHPCHTHATLPGGAAVSAAPTEHSCTNIVILPRNPRNTQKLLA
jgi:hypothetical protein